ncbi:MAG: Ig-like domain-containing protein, partial [Bacteroides sp.]|nr:Ig-like domain-containing protein [Bacteroides sp.]
RLWFEFSVRGVEMNTSRATVAKGSSIVLNAAVIPQEASDKTVVWSSDNVMVATVDQQGTVTGNSAGKAVITATSAEGGFTAACEVTVVIPVEQVLFAEKEIYVPLATTVALSYSVLPEDATDKNVIFSSLNPGVALTGGPYVYGVEVGTTRLVAVSEDGAASDTCTVHVVEPITAIVLNENSITMDKKTPTFQLVATVYPEQAASTPVVWSSDDHNVAQVTNTGLVYAQDKGQTVVRVSSPDGDVSAQCLVTVTEPVSNQGGARNVLSAAMVNGDIAVTASCGMEWIKVYNLSGQCVATRKVDGAGKVTVEASRYPQGVYLLQIRLTGGGTVNTKVVK